MPRASGNSACGDILTPNCNEFFNQNCNLFSQNIVQALLIDEEVAALPAMVDTTTLKHFAKEAEVL